jgi:hypothetical protein
MEPASSLRFATVAHLLAEEARRLELVAPGFRSPPRRPGVDRSLRRRGADAQVAVRLRARPFAAVVADMVEGVVAANRLAGPDADRCRNALWAVAEAELAAHLHHDGDAGHRRVA